MRNNKIINIEINEKKMSFPGDKLLIQSLVLDAKVTQDFEKKSEKSLHKEENLK